VRPTAVYCDGLTIRKVLALLWARGTGRLRSGTVVWLLDGPLGGVTKRLQGRLLAAAGLTVQEARFFAGHLRTADGEALRPAARRAAFELTLTGTRRLLDRTPWLAAMNDRWQRNTMLLHVAQQFWSSTDYVVLRLLVADALCRQAGQAGAEILLTRPVRFVPIGAAALVPNLRVRLLTPWQAVIGANRLAAVAWWLRHQYRALRSQTHRSALSDETGSTRPALLLLQEDELLADRSLRSQPHWLFPDATPPAFDTLVLASPSVPWGRPDAEALTRLGVTVIQSAEIHALGRESAVPAQLLAALSSDVRRCLLRSVTAVASAAVAAAEFAARMLEEARSLAAFCCQRNVRAFVTAETYMRASSSMLTIAPALGIRTISYQYSNLSFPSLLLLTTADVMATMSPHFHSRFVWHGIQPTRFVDIGYAYDGSFPLVKGRAAACRKRLTDAGASYVVCYFDESVQTDRYGLVHATEYEAELLELVERLMADPTLGLVLKPQFQRNLDGRSARFRAAVEAALATGRFEIPSHGRHRNSVLPGEAAMAADVAIGHIFGGTASLEAALVGTRSLILNPYGFRGANDGLYALSDIVYPTLDAALEAIARHRRGEPGARALGDWSGIIEAFDPWRDGRSCERLRALVEEAMSPSNSSEPAGN
jgi:hypothetical protein